jgi:hypothetical protein
MDDVAQRSGGDSSSPAPWMRRFKIQSAKSSACIYQSNTSKLGSSSDFLYILICRVVGYQNAGQAHLDRWPTTVLPEVCALLLQEQFIMPGGFIRREPTDSTKLRRNQEVVELFTRAQWMPFCDKLQGYDDEVAEEFLQALSLNP